MQQRRQALSEMERDVIAEGISSSSTLSEALRYRLKTEIQVLAFLAQY